MKKIVVILLFSLFGTCFAFENTTAQWPQAQFQSVNTCKAVTNYEPNIIAIGVETPYAPSRPRKVGPDPYDPFLDPIGDVPLILMLLLAALYAVRKFAPRRGLGQNPPQDTNF